MGDLSQHIEGLTEESGKILKSLEDLSAEIAAGKVDAEAGKAQLKVLGDQMSALQEQAKAEANEKAAAELRAQVDELRAQVGQIREPSKGKLIGTGKTDSGEPEAGFFWSLWASKQQDPGLAAYGKAQLESMGSTWADKPDYSKATLGTTAGSGGNIVPQNVVTDLTKISTAANAFRRLLTVQDVGYVTGVNIPVQGLVPSRAVVAAAGATKANVDLTYTSYTATMYTIARIYDMGNQFLRNSRGAAEADVRDSLARAFALGEAYYVLQGSGTSEPKGVLTSIGTSGTFVSSFTASSTTLAGSSAAAIAKATGALANRARIADGVVCNASDFWIMAAQGTDSAGFFLAPANGPGAIDPTNMTLRIWGLPVYGDPNMPTDSMVVGEWKSAKLYTGQGYRVDVSDQAGTRWDTNETGFRGEEEIGFNADPYVTAGMFQRVTDFTP